VLARQLEMSRNVIQANVSIFSLLDHFCAARNMPLANAGLPRWIASENKHRYPMRKAVVSERLALGTIRKVARVDLDRNVYICALGFDNPNPLPDLVEVEVNAAFLTVVLSELLPLPKASPLEIKDVVEAFDSTAGPGYNGHDPNLIATLFPSIRIFSARDLAAHEAIKYFFRICVAECDFGDSWIETELAHVLRLMCELDANKIPYRVLCRSVFDADPTSFFLALYRCLEALYAFSSAKRLIDVLALGSGIPWAGVAAALETELGWWPREESSLAQLLLMAATQDLMLIKTVLTEGPDGGLAENLHHHTAQRIYKLRNAIVHYRPAHQSLDFGKIDWNTLCVSMAAIVLYVYSQVFDTE
jgi:hypothetical protein